MAPFFDSQCSLCYTFTVGLLYCCRWRSLWAVVHPLVEIYCSRRRLRYASDDRSLVEPSRVLDGPPFARISALSGIRRIGDAGNIKLMSVRAAHMRGRDHMMDHVTHANITQDDGFALSVRPIWTCWKEEEEDKCSAVAEMGDRLATTDTGRKWAGAVPLLGKLRPPSDTMSAGPRPTSLPRGILIHPTVWPQYTNVTDRQNNGLIAYGEPIYKRSPNNWNALALGCFQ